MTLRPLARVDSLDSAAAAGPTLLLRTWPVRDALVTMAVALALVSPMLPGEAFSTDWRNHLFLVAKQASYVRAHLGPTPFVSTESGGWFYPHFGYYGATLYYLVGLAGATIGSAWAAYVGSLLLGVAAAFAGWTWLARQAGLRGWPGYLPGGVYVAGAYYLTDIYARGAWPEFIAISAIPLTMAAGWSALTRPLRPFSLLILAASVGIQTGSHTITLIYGSAFVALALAAALLLRLPSRPSPGAFGRTLGVAALAIGVNAWFLVPLVDYRKLIHYTPGLLADLEFGRLDNLFSLLPRMPAGSTTPQLYVQAPDIPLLAALLTCVVGAAMVVRPRLLALAALGVCGVALLVFMMEMGPEAWARLPRELLVLQSVYRLSSYILACAAGLVLVAACYAAEVRARRPRVGACLLGLLGFAVLVQLGFGLRQAWSAQRGGPAVAVATSLERLPEGWYFDDYYSSDLGILSHESYPRYQVRAQAPDLNATELHITIPARMTGGLVRTNVVPSGFIRWDLSAAPGAEIAGQADNFVALRVPRSDEDVQLSVRAVWTRPRVLGAAISAASLLGLLGIFILALRTHYRGPALAKS